MKFAEYLAEKQGAPLYRVEVEGADWLLTKYQHVERLGHDDVSGLLDGTVIVQEKVDGANFTVAKHPVKGIILASRNQVVSVGGSPSNGFNGAIEYVLDHPGFVTLFDKYPDWVLRCEWLVRHSVNYAKEHLRKLYVYDVQDGEGNYINPNVYEPWLNAAGIPIVPTLATIEKPDLERLTTYVQGTGAFGAEQKEGIVVKRYDFVNKYGRVAWGKLVAADFREANKLHMGAAKHDPCELRFAAQITDEDVLKVVHKIKDEVGTTTIKDMSQVIGRVWHDAFVDRLWDFVKKEHVGSFDFQQAKKLVDKKAREVALAYYNGLLQ